MLKLTLKSLVANKIRFALTTFAVVLGVAFVSGSFVIADSIRQAFSGITDSIEEAIDVQVRGAPQFEGDSGSLIPIPQSEVDKIEALDGLEFTFGTVFGTLRLSRLVADDDGAMIPDLIGGGGPPAFGSNWNYDGPFASESSAVELNSGRPPGPDEVVLDPASLAGAGLAVGDVIQVRAVTEDRAFTISGTATLVGQAPDIGGFSPTFAYFDLQTTRELFSFPEGYLQFDVSSSIGETPDQLAARVQAVLSPEFEAVTGETVADELNQTFELIVGIFQTALLAFATVALVVSAFIINNTFAIVIGQRIRELGLLRCLGATGRQVRRSVLGESLVVGLLASFIGLFAGLGVAWGITTLLNQASDGGGLPTAVVLSPRTWIASFVVGVGVTMIASFAPARRASTVPPIAALSDQFTLADRRGTRRIVVGAVLGLLGALLLVGGVAGGGPATGRLLFLGVGSLLVFIAVALLSPLIARIAVRLMGVPVVRLGKVPGRLARNNAARNPRRTASTASALMVGLALVTMVLVVGTSFKQTFVSALETSVTADYFIQPSTNDGLGFSPRLAQDVNALPEVEVASSFRGDFDSEVEINNGPRGVFSAEEVALERMVNIGVVDGTVEGLDSGGLLVHKDSARDEQLAVGDAVEVRFPLGNQTLTVVGIYEDTSILTTNWIISNRSFEQGFGPTEQQDVFVSAIVADGVDHEVARTAIERVTRFYPEVELQDRAELRDSVEAQIDQLLIVVNALLVFAVAIAALGVINTLMLSVFERTREIGLLRAVGMTRRQTRRMIRWEAVLIAAFGGVLGVGLGLVFGLVAITALPESFVSTVGVPIGQLIGIVIACMVVGVLAAIFPARRAARMNVLDAIAHE